MNLYFRLVKYLKPYFISIVGIMVATILVSVCNVAVIPLVGKLSEVIGNKNIGSLNIIILVALGVYFFKGIFMYCQSYLAAYVSNSMIKDLRIDLYNHIQGLSLDFFHKYRTGDIGNRVVNEVGTVQSELVANATEVLPNIITLCGVVGYLLYLNWQLAFLSLVMLPVLFYTMARIGREMRSISLKGARKVADIAHMLLENLTGIRVIKAFTMEAHEAKKFAEESDASLWISLRQAAINATSTPILSFIQSLAVLGVVWYGAYQVVSGTLSASSLIAFFTGVALLADPVSKLSKMNITIQRALASAERIFEIADIVPSVREKPNAKKLEKIDGSVEFRGVFFHYDKSEGEALKDINVKVKPGEIIALVGPSGAGKTTFANLIPRFYDPTKGKVLIDGINLEDCELYSLRRRMGIVPQETMLFSGTIRHNILCGDFDATEERVVTAAKMANAHDFITEFPEGYNTYVGERGIRLSGGQRQRIAIARALLRDPRILILDEATSSLDTESERLVQDALEKLMKGRTTFVIAHRLSTVQIADRILVFKDARIIEEGTHRELLDKGGLYKRLYEMQFRDDRKPKEAV
jgi:subfamily B ATP-binding cassette protein MsbA